MSEWHRRAARRDTKQQWAGATRTPRAAQEHAGTQAHIPTRMRARTRTHTHTRTRTRAHAHTHTLTRTRTRSYAPPNQHADELRPHISKHSETRLFEHLRAVERGVCGHAHVCVSANVPACVCLHGCVCVCVCVCVSVCVFTCQINANMASSGKSISAFASPGFEKSTTS